MAASPYAGAVSHVLWHFPYVFAVPPCDSAASHAGHSPIGFAALPYDHTPAASPHTSRQIPTGRPFSHSHGRSPIARPSPHTSRQIPTGRPFSHSHGRSPIARPSPHTIHNLLKVGLSFDETSGSSSTNAQPTTSSKHPEPALQSSKPSAGQFQQITHTCEWGAPSPPARKAMVMRSSSRPWSRAHFHGHAYGHGHTFTGYAHGHVNVRARF